MSRRPRRWASRRVGPGRGDGARRSNGGARGGGSRQRGSRVYSRDTRASGRLDAWASVWPRVDRGRTCDRKNSRSHEVGTVAQKFSANFESWGGRREQRRESLFQRGSDATGRFPSSACSFRVSRDLAPLTPGRPASPPLRRSPRPRAPLRRGRGSCISFVSTPRDPPCRPSAA